MQHRGSSSEWTLQVSSSRIKLKSVPVFIFKHGSVSAWEFLFLPLISSNLDHFLRARILSHKMRTTSFFHMPAACPIVRRLKYVFDSITRSPLWLSIFLSLRNPLLQRCRKRNRFIYFSWSGYERGLFSWTSLPLLRKCVRSSAEDEVRHSTDL